MGRNSQELMTGLTHEERVQRAKRRGFFNRIKSIFRLNKPAPTKYANIRRHGQAQDNPALMKNRTQETSDSRTEEDKK